MRRAVASIVAEVILMAIVITASLAVFAITTNYAGTMEKGPSVEISSISAQSLPNGGLYLDIQVTNTGSVPFTLSLPAVYLNGQRVSLSGSWNRLSVGAGSTAEFAGITTGSVGAFPGANCTVIVKASSYAVGATVMVT
ncbi:MAG: hypothetical protein JRN10_04090 [Nitrososphaerota archaeon]|jgi:FlaG/FlaF family flagellin (archaellin)|nr:hypothetical protein [Nitrososphaerota archaeon]MDG6930406.1 hypothetical protein [Nitrososphaerota archaeon]